MLAVRPYEVERLEMRRSNPQYPGGPRLLTPTAPSNPGEATAALRRVPKLAVRNRGPGATSSPNSTATAQGNGENASLAQTSTTSLAPNMSSTLERRQSDHSHVTAGSLSLMESRDGNFRQNGRDQQPEKKKKKASGMLGFLTLKEPSTSAWEEYAQQQKKAAGQMATRKASIGMVGVSSQKLPEFVPKTNSAWDGLPDTAKRRSSDNKARSNRTSTISTTTRHSSRSGGSSFSNGSGGNSPARKYGSLSSKVPRPQSSTLSQSKGGSARSSTSVDESKRMNRVAAPTIVHPALRGKNAVTPWDEPESEPEQDRQVDGGDGTDEVPKESPETFLSPPSPPPVLPEAFSLLPSPDFEIPEMPLLEESDASSVLQASPLASPLVTPVYEQPSAPASIEEKSAAEIGIAPLGTPVTFWNSDTDNEDAGLETGTSGLRKAPLNFSRPRLNATAVHEDERPATIEEDDEDVDRLQPTLRDDTGRTLPFIFDFYDAAHASDHSDSAQKRRMLAKPVSTTAAAHVRADSTSSHVTSVTTTTATSVAPEPQSPTFSIVTRTSSRPSTATSVVTVTTACRRSSESPERSNSDAASIAPSIMSVQWTMSPKERLGLGGKLVRRDQVDVLPWEQDEQEHPLRSSTPVNRMSTASKRASMMSQATTSSETGKLKRLSMRLARK